MARSSRWASWARGAVALGSMAALCAAWLGTPAAAARPRAGVDWATYGFDLTRTGWNPTETVLTPSTVPNLKLHWSFDLGAVTIMQPVLASGVLVNGNPTDVVYIGAEHGDLYALDAADGSLVWQDNLGSQDTGCFDMPDGIFGVSGSPFIDRGGNRLFVVGGDGQLYALDLSTGATLAGWPVQSRPSRATSTRTAA